MAGKSSDVGALLYEAETVFGEDVDTTATRLRPIGKVELDLQQPGQKQEILRQYPNEGVAFVRMPQAGTISFTKNLTGLGSTAAGAAPASALATFLGTVFGTTATGLATGTTATGGTATVPTTTAASGATAGSLVKVGVKGDGRADGQWAAVASHSGSDLTLLTALPVAPDNGDVVYASRMVYGYQNPSTASDIASVRFRYQSARQQYVMHGCYPTGAELMIAVGEVPRVKLTYAVAHWETANDTFPSAVSVQDFTAAPVAGGSLFMNTVGTATRATLAARSVTFSLGMNNQAEIGTNAAGAYQIVTGAMRGPESMNVEFVVDAEAAGSETYLELAAQHALYTMSTVDGRSLALYWPNLRQTEQRPTQFDDGGILRMRLKFEATTGATTTTDLTMSPWRLGMA
jgi:hypothetical protein